MAYVYEFLQLLLVGPMTAIYLLANLLRKLNPVVLLRDLGDAIARGPYYWTVRKKRAARGEPLWQPHDAKLGYFWDPADTSTASAVPAISEELAYDGPRCGCGVPRAPDEDLCFTCWRARVNLRLDGLENHP